MGCPACKSKDELIAGMVEAWSKVVWRSPEEKKEANRRAQICLEGEKDKMPCKSNKNNTCVQCGIWIPALARSMKEGCPINKW